MGITSTCSNTTYPRTNINYPMVPYLEGFQLHHLVIMISCLQVCQNGIKWYSFNLAKAQSTITIKTQYYT